MAATKCLLSMAVCGSRGVILDPLFSSSFSPTVHQSRSPILVWIPFDVVRRKSAKKVRPVDIMKQIVEESLHMLPLYVCGMVRS